MLGYKKYHEKNEKSEKLSRNYSVRLIFFYIIGEDTKCTEIKARTLCRLEYSINRNPFIFTPRA